MMIIELNEDQFRSYARFHSNRNYFQTVEFANMYELYGYKKLYVGLVDDNNNLIAASLLLLNKIKGYKYAYAPRGFLINYDNKEDLSWLQVLKNLLKERNLEYNDEILKKVTKEITKAGYDIITKPFKLERYK